MEFITGIVVGLGLSYVNWAIAAIVVAILIATEHAEHHIASAVVFVAGVGLTFVMLRNAQPSFELGLGTLFMAAVLYVVIGVVWSVVRYGIMCNRHIQKYMSESTRSSLDTPSSVKDYLKPSKNIDRIVSWIVNWPISMIVTSLHEVIDALGGFVKGSFKAVYEAVYSWFLRKFENALNKYNPE